MTVKTICFLVILTLALVLLPALSAGAQDNCVWVKVTVDGDTTTIPPEEPCATDTICSPGIGTAHPGLVQHDSVLVEYFACLNP